MDIATKVARIKAGKERLNEGIAPFIIISEICCLVAQDLPKSKVKADFTCIQNAINAASSNDVIYVYSGVYYENIVINKSIKIMGENNGNTIIASANTGSTI